MHLERKKDLSVYFWLKTTFSDVSSFVAIEDGFPTETELQVPSIAIEWDIMTSAVFEMGNRKGDYVRSWYIDVFAKNKSQRDDFTYRLIEAMENTIPVYDYDEGIPEDNPPTQPTQIGYMTVLDKEIKRFKVFAELVTKLHERSQVRFSTNFSFK
jgi:hypothetical protein